MDVLGSKLEQDLKEEKKAGAKRFGIKLYAQTT